MRSNLLTSAAMLMALLATAPVNAEEEAAKTQTEAVDAGMAEAAAEQEAMEMEANESASMSSEPQDAVTAQVETSAYVAPVDHGVTPPEITPVERDVVASDEADTTTTKTAEVETTVREEVVGTEVEMSGPAALPPQDLNIPVRGMHMEQVEITYGKPMGINPPVGEPPITRWDYPGFAVYFEYSYVIQSVPK